MSKPVIPVEHYSDVLCVWAYIAQIRVEELEATFPDEVVIDFRFLQVFGDVPGKMASQWADRGGIAGYAGHVQEVAGAFEHCELNPKVWQANTPASSLPAHLVLCGLKAMGCSEFVAPVLRLLRRAFFVDLVDISNHDALLEVVRGSNADLKQLQEALDSGAAHAQLSADLVAAAQVGVRSSPTLTFNEGRQTLAGNVGYRVLEANIRELLHSPADQQSWC
ncbi:MAG: DsbA family oxidoreductase [Gammaproteobacteria bacterium]